MFLRLVAVVLLSAALLAGPATTAAGYGQQQQRPQRAQTDATPVQRLEVMRSRLDAMRRSLNSAVAALNARDGGDQSSRSADDPRSRLRALEQDVNSVFSEVNDLRGKVDRAERYEVLDIDRLETVVAELNGRVETTLQETSGERRAAAATASSAPAQPRRGFFGRIFGRGGNSRHDELTRTVAPGRDRELFTEATGEARRGRYESARLLYTVIITTYPESPFLPAAKLAIADTFYLEGGSSALIQAGAAYRDWLTFFPTHPLADDVMLKMAEVEMRQMGRPDRDVSHARRAEVQLKALLQQFPNTPLREAVQVRLNEVQENLGMHNLSVANFYYSRYERGVAPNPRGAQSRLREIAERYPNFSYMDEVLFRLGVTFMQEEEPDEAAKHFQQLLRNYPNSEYAERARQQLEIIGAPAPAPDPSRASETPPERPTFTQRLLSEVTGTARTTTSRDGVLINKEGESDLIAEVIAAGGTLPQTTPDPVQRRAPAVAPPVRPATQVSAPARDVTLQPTQPGPPRTGDNPAAPPATTPQTPASNPPPQTPAPTPTPAAGGTTP